MVKASHLVISSDLGQGNEDCNKLASYIFNGDPEPLWLHSTDSTTSILHQKCSLFCPKRGLAVNNRCIKMQGLHFFLQAIVFQSWQCSASCICRRGPSESRFGFATATQLYQVWVELRKLLRICQVRPTKTTQRTVLKSSTTLQTHSHTRAHNKYNAYATHICSWARDRRSPPPTPQT